MRKITLRLFEIIGELPQRAAATITRNRRVTGWGSLLDDSVPANPARDRLANNAHQVIIEGEGYRNKKGTKRTIM